MNSEISKAIRRLCYAGTSSHGFTCKSREYKNAHASRGFMHTNKPSLGGGMFKIEPLEADSFRKMYQRVKREYSRGEGGWEELIADEIIRFKKTNKPR